MIKQNNNKRIITFEKDKFLTLLSPAKLNLCLNILDRLSDGYHLINTIIAPLSLADEIQIKLDYGSKGVRVKTSFIGHLAEHLNYLKQKDKKIELTINELNTENNLAYKAAILLLEQCYKKKNIGLEISIAKKIPFSAGLGGGSSNAASVLIGLNELLDLKCKRSELVEYAKSLGSDVPAFIYNSPVYAFRRGEQVYPLNYKFTADFHFLIFKPTFGIETKLAYQSLGREIKYETYQHDIHGLLSLNSLITLRKFGFESNFVKKSDQNPDNMLTLLQETGISTIPNSSNIEACHLSYTNDFQDRIDMFCPEIKNLEKEIYDLGASKVLLAGSGSSLAIFAREQNGLTALEDNLRKRYEGSFLQRVAFSDLS